MWMAASMVFAGHAQSVPVLAELFTSEGCSSCPPADALLMRLDNLQPVRGAQIIVLSEHVDYWNDLGWRDPYSSAQFSKRQADYARVLGSESYTPQLVIDGRDQMNGADATAVQVAIARAAARPKAAIRTLQAHRDGGEAVVQLAIDAQLRRGDIWLAIASESARSSVGRGENAGRTLDHVAVVRSLAKIGTLRKAQFFEKTVRVAAPADAARVVVFLQDTGSPVTGAAVAVLR